MSPRARARRTRTSGHPSLKGSESRILSQVGVGSLSVQFRSAVDWLRPTDIEKSNLLFFPQSPNVNVNLEK